MRLLSVRPRPTVAVVAVTAFALCATACSTRAAPPPEPDRPAKIGCTGGGGGRRVVPVFAADAEPAVASVRIGTGPCGVPPTGVVVAAAHYCLPTELVIGPPGGGTRRRHADPRPPDLPCVPSARR